MLNTGGGWSYKRSGFESVTRTEAESEEKPLATLVVARLRDELPRKAIGNRNR